MNIGLSYAKFYVRPFEDFIRTAVKNGFSWLEFVLDQAPNLLSDLTRPRVKELVRIREECNLRYSVHNIFYDINLLSLEPSVAEFAFKMTESVMTFCRNIGAESLTVHPGYMFPGWRRDPKQRRRFWANTGRALQRLADLSDQYGIRVLLENGGYCITTLSSVQRTPLHVGVTSGEMRKLLASAPSVIGVTMDLGKAVESGEDLKAWELCCGRRLRQIQLGAERYLDSGDAWVIKALDSHRDGLDVMIEAPLDVARKLRQRLKARSATSVHEERPATGRWPRR